MGKGPFTSMTGPPPRWSWGQGLPGYKIEVCFLCVMPLMRWKMKQLLSLPTSSFRSSVHKYFTSNCKFPIFQVGVAHVWKSGSHEGDILSPSTDGASKPTEIETHLGCSKDIKESHHQHSIYLFCTGITCSIPLKCTGCRQSLDT